MYIFENYVIFKITVSMHIFDKRKSKKMKLTLEERFRKKMRRIGKKNMVCRVCIFPVYALGMLLFRVANYFKANGKRFAMVAMTFLLFTVYSSFSFPMFISGDGSENGLNEVSEVAQNVELATETEIKAGDIILLDDADVLTEDDDAELAHGMKISETYSANDILGEEEENISEEPQATAEPVATEEPVADEENSRGANAYRDYDFSADDWRIMLINKQHSIPEDYEPVLGEINTMKGIMQCDERIIDELKLMMQDAKKDGIVLAICSPYRDMEYQKMLFNRKINRYMDMGLSYMEAYRLAGEYVTVPGASEHQLGLALDIVCNTYTSLNDGFGDTDAGKWLAANCHKYGFILRYPEDKEDITGIGYEPWHFRYVGVEAATIIMEDEITLEEFWEEYL